MTEPAGRPGKPRGPGRFSVFDRPAWAALRAATPLTLSAEDLGRLRGINEAVELDEVTDVYLPLARLLELHLEARAALQDVSNRFLGEPTAPVPFVVAVAGSVAVGKSTTARLLQALLSRSGGGRRVELVATDGFLFPNAVLADRGLMERKGFPESYDQRRLVTFLADLKGGAAELDVPVYSHERYDIVPDRHQVVTRPDVVVVEGLNLLGGDPSPGADHAVVSDFFDFSIYVDASEADIERWFVERLVALRSRLAEHPDSPLEFLAGLDDDAVRQVATGVWGGINGVNLKENIAPTRERAHLILEKGPDHAVRVVRLRRL